MVELFDDDFTIRQYPWCTATRNARFDAIEISTKLYRDDRGYFMETYRERDIQRAIIDLTKCSVSFVQENESFSRKGVIRGLHYQSPRAQGKLVRAVSGDIFDVAVCLDPGSDSFGNWISVVLSSANKNQFWVPPGYAHGFQVLSENATVIYKVTDYYSPDTEQCLQWSDPDLAISWPLPDPTVSEKDQLGLRWKDVWPKLRAAHTKK